jgi:hypothetical protein
MAAVSVQQKHVKMDARLIAQGITTTFSPDIGATLLAA